MENGSTKWANPYKDNHRFSDGAQSFGGVFEETSPIVIYKQTVCSVYLPVHAACYRQTCSTPRSWLRYLQAAGTVGLRPWRYVVWIFNWDRLTGRDVNTEFSPSFWDWRQGEDGGGCAVTFSLSDIQNNTSLTALSHWWCSSFFKFYFPANLSLSTHICWAHIVLQKRKHSQSRTLMIGRTSVMAVRCFTLHVS